MPVERHGELERVAAVAWWYAAAVLQPRWWNRLPLAVLPLLALVLLAVAVAADDWPFALAALVVLLAGALVAWQRMTTVPLLRLMRPAEAADVPPAPDEDTPARA